MTSEANAAPQIASSSPRRIVAATVVAVLAAAFLLVTAVLPAEYGIDPLGTGRVLGLVELAGSAPTAVSAQTGPHNVDLMEFVLGPYQSVEYKYRIEEGGTLTYSWQATREVLYDFHSEPDGAPQGYAESFDQGKSYEAFGTYTAPFSGIHGWYWENGGEGEVSISLMTAGFYSSSQEYFDNDILRREFPNRPSDSGARPPIDLESSAGAPPSSRP
jgi:hypothetical protein